MIYLYAIRNKSEKHDNKIFLLMPILSTQKISKLENYTYKENKEQSILGESLVRYILWRHYGISSKEVALIYNEYGKPLLANSEIFFSISHSGEWVVCGVSDTCIGVDVESRENGNISVATRCFSKKEYEYISNELVYNQQEIFLKLWTLKESYVKCIGKGLSISLDSFEFEFVNSKISMYKNGVQDVNYTFKNIKINDEYSISICISDKKCNIWNNDINIISVDDLLIWRAKYKY